MRTSSLPAFLAVACVPLAGLAPPAHAAAPLGAEYAPDPAETFDLGSLRVQRYGDRGRPVVLVPGLAGGAWVWRDTIQWLRADHVVYAVTLAGFDGRPVPEGPGSLLDSAAESLVRLLVERKLERPVLVGHSLGGALALRIATENAAKLGGVVAVDGLPVFPGMERFEPAPRTAMAANLRAQLEGATPEAFAAQQLAYMQRVGVLDAAAAARWASLNARSDAKAVARYVGEVTAADVRPGLARAAVPILEISPYHAPDFATPPLVLSESQKTDYYRVLLAGAPDARVVSIAPARHFVMLDQPAAFRRALVAFLDGL
jgi:pimeloyl-ACP methyl ester carboxylesterase